MQKAIRARAATPIRTASQSRSMTVATSRELYSVIEQKVRVASSPTEVPPGTESAVEVQLVIDPSGSSHFSFIFGPSGPLNSGSPRWPQRPSNNAQANGPSGSTGLGMTTACNGVGVPGAVVLSQPKPLPFSPQLMNSS